VHRHSLPDLALDSRNGPLGHQGIVCDVGVMQLVTYRFPVVDEQVLNKSHRLPRTEVHTAFEGHDDRSLLRPHQVDPGNRSAPATPARIGPPDARCPAGRFVAAVPR
jgi:hypothetical protein